jgi:chemosensory pili system protein ChpB (putative protein-glutamate methylesterase)
VPATKFATAPNPVRVGILGTTLMGRADLREGLEAHGLQVVVEETLSGFLTDLDHQNQLDVLLVALEQADDDDLDVLDALVEHSPVPMVFHAVAGHGASSAWMRKLAAKLADAGRARPVLRVEPTPPQPPVVAVAANVVVTTPLPAAAQPGVRAKGLPEGLRLWVLGASFGGPEALKRFLSSFRTVPANTAFLIGQHIGDGFVEVLAAQLNRATPFSVMPAASGLRLESGRVYVAPVRERVLIDDSGMLHLVPDGEKRVYQPSIDALMEEAAARFGADCGAIIFSGMGDDGTRGCRAVASAGGAVWAQDSASCAIDSMPSCARATGLVRRMGSPEALAGQLALYLDEHATQGG